MSISASSSLSPTTPLNPHAQSWIPEAQTTSFDDQYPSHVKKSVLMLPASVINIQPFRQFHLLLPQPIATSSYLFHDPSVQYHHMVFNYIGSYSCPSEPQEPYQHAVMPRVTLAVPHISWNCTTNEYEVERDDFRKGLVDSGTEKKRDSGIYFGQIDWKTKRRFVPPRLQERQNMVYQGRKNTGKEEKAFTRQEWKLKKTESDGVVSADAALVFSSPLPTESSVVDFQHRKKTTVMIRNIPIQYRRESLMQFLDVYCKNHNLEYDFFYLPMDFRTHDNLGYGFVNFTTPAAAMTIMDLLQGFEWYGNMISGKRIKSKKICAVSWADIQGKAALVEHFQFSYFACYDSEYLPVILSPPRNGSTGNRINLPITVGELKGGLNNNKKKKNHRQRLSQSLQFSGRRSRLLI